MISCSNPHDLMNSDSSGLCSTSSGVLQLTILVKPFSFQDLIALRRISIGELLGFPCSPLALLMMGGIEVSRSKFCSIEMVGNSRYKSVGLGFGCLR